MIFVTGGTGFTGRYVVNRLLKQGHPLTCLVRPGRDFSALWCEGVRFVEGDLEAPDGLALSMAGAQVLVSVAHVRFAPGLIAACKQAGVSRAVFVSSTWRFSGVKTPRVREVIAAEEAVEQSGLDYTILRPTMIYGPGDDRNVSRVRGLIRKWGAFPVFGSGQGLVQPVFVDDVAQAVCAALLCEAAIGKAYAVAGPEPMPYVQMLNILGKGMGRRVRHIYVPVFVGLFMARLGAWLTPNFPLRVDQIQRMQEDRAFEIADAVRDLGFSPRDFETGQCEVLRENGEVA